jgi:hypothetical protein
LENKWLRYGNSLCYLITKLDRMVVHIIRNALGGGGQRFVTKPLKNIGNCRVLRYEGKEGGSKSWKFSVMYYDHFGIIIFFLSHIFYKNRQVAGNLKFLDTDFIAGNLKVHGINGQIFDGKSQGVVH